VPPSLCNNLATLAGKKSGRGRWYQQDHSVEEVRVFWNSAHAETLPPRHAGSWERQYNGLGFGLVPWADRFTFHFSETDQY
jgi:hypothetical protein